MPLSDVTGYCIFGLVRVGSNGAVPGTPECATGKSASSQSTGRRAWDSNLLDGLDSGWLPVTLTLNASGNATGGVEWVVGASGSLTTTNYSGAKYGEILSVTLRAAVDGAGRRMSFRNTVVGFFTNQTDASPDEAITLSTGSNPVASTVGQSDPIDAEQIVEISPDGSGYVKIVVAAEVRLECVDHNLPGSQGIVGQVFVFTSSCS
jgi:hypothetical protein